MNDLISRKALLDEIDRSDKANLHSGVANRSIHHYEHLHFMNMVLNAPAVEAEPKHGRWIPLEYDGFADGNPVWYLWGCSECGEEHSGDEDTLTPYCPNCGAKMDLEVTP